MNPDVAQALTRLDLAGLDIEPERCDPEALRAIAADLIVVANALDSAG